MRADRDLGDTSVVRNLDLIQEEDPRMRPTRAGALVLASISGACIVLAAAFMVRAPRGSKVTTVDPLSDLIARTRPAAGAVGGEKVGQEVTFPGLLSDVKQPTTALEAVREGRSDPAHPAPPFPLASGTPMAPLPNAADQLPVVPLPAQSVLQDPSRELPAGDHLGTIARHVSRDVGGETALSGGPGGYQLQVSSFKTAAEAEAFATALRRRGHKAYVEAAHVKSRGTWHRVRVGPFKFRHSAVIYRQEFEAKERIVTFIVDPPKEGSPLAGVRPASRLETSDDSDE